MSEHKLKYVTSCMNCPFHDNVQMESMDGRTSCGNISMSEQRSKGLVVLNYGIPNWCPERKGTKK